MLLCWHQQTGLLLVTKWKLLIRKEDFFSGCLFWSFLSHFSSIMKEHLKEGGMWDEIRTESFFPMNRERLFQLTFAIYFALTPLSKRLTLPLPELVICGKRVVTGKEIPLMLLNTGLMMRTRCYYEIRKSGRNKQLDILLPFYRVTQTQTTCFRPFDLEMGNMTTGCFSKSETKEILDFLKNYTLEWF